MDKGFVGGFVGLVCTIGILCFIVSLGKTECSMYGCDKEAKEGSRYCYLHNMSYRYYGTPDYNAVYDASVQRRESNLNSKKETTSESKRTASGSSSAASKSTKSTSGKVANPYQAYDEGYEAISEDEDYDWDRYWSDSEYADGVDDAMDECDW